MKPPRFRYARPERLADAIELVDGCPSCLPLAGGQSVVPLLNLRKLRPAIVVDLNEITELAGLDVGAGSVEIGALTRMAELGRASFLPTVVGEALRHVGNPPVRNRGTVGGSLAHADPVAELPCVMLALDATVRLRSARATREVPASGFFRGPFETTRRPDELVVSVRVGERTCGQGSAFEELSPRFAAPAIVSAAAVVTTGASGVLASVRVAIAGAGGRAVLVPGLDALDSQELDRAVVSGVDEIFGGASEGQRFRRDAATALVGRALARAIREAASRSQQPA